VCHDVTIAEVGTSGKTTRPLGRGVSPLFPQKGIFNHRLITLRVLPEVHTQILLLKKILFSFFPVFNLTADYADCADWEFNHRLTQIYTDFIIKKNPAFLLSCF